MSTYIPQKKKPDFNQSQEDEVGFAHHVFEFERFFNRQRVLNDEIAGLKKVGYYDENKYYVEYLIKKTNFGEAIKKVYSFIIDNIHYIQKNDDKKYFFDRISEIEKEYLSDDDYQMYVEMQDKLNIQNEVNFEIKYLYYLMRLFSLNSEFFFQLGWSIMTSTKTRVKKIKFWDDKFFYSNNSIYRDETSTAISHFRFSNMIDTFKKVLAYFHTYEIYVDNEYIGRINSINKRLYNYIVTEEVADLIKKSKNNKLNHEERKKVARLTVIIRNALGYIYYKTNKSLSERNILPKIQQRVDVDKTGI